MAQIQFTVTFVIEECCNCHMQFAVTQDFQQRRQRDHARFYCPSGHGMSYNGPSDIEKLKREKAEAENRLQAQINEARHAQLVAEKERDSERRKRRKVEKRVAGGACPCCNRTFGDLAAHMKCKHKEFALPASAQKQITGTVN